MSMTLHRVRRLEEQVAADVQQMLTEGDEGYLRSLSLSELHEALQDELYFLGLYPRDDVAAQTVGRNYLTHHLQDWHTSLHQHSLPMPALSGLPR